MSAVIRVVCHGGLAITNGSICSYGLDGLRERKRVAVYGAAGGLYALPAAARWLCTSTRPRQSRRQERYLLRRLSSPEFRVLFVFVVWLFMLLGYFSV